MKLAYKDMSIERKKQEDKLMVNDPKKAAQFERLGMGFSGHKYVLYEHLCRNFLKEMECSYLNIFK